MVTCVSEIVRDYSYNKCPHICLHLLVKQQRIARISLQILSLFSSPLWAPSQARTRILRSFCSLGKLYFLCFLTLNQLLNTPYQQPSETSLKALVSRGANINNTPQTTQALF